jgi:hypothetical protein
MHNTALNSLIQEKLQGNLERRAKSVDQPGKVYKTVDPMKKRHTVRKGQYLFQVIFKVQKGALHSFIGHAVRWGLGMRCKILQQPWNHTFHTFLVTLMFIAYLQIS